MDIKTRTYGDYRLNYKMEDKSTLVRSSSHGQLKDDLTNLCDALIRVVDA